MKTTLFLAICFATAGTFCVASAQVRVALRLDESRKPLWGFFQLCDEKHNCGLAQGELAKVSAGSQDLLMAVSRAGRDFNLLVDTNQNSTLADEKKIYLRNNGIVRIRIRKQTAAKRYEFLPFEIEHEAPDEQGDTIDRFLLRPHYVASGRLTYGKCNSMVSLLDYNLDGKFTSADSDRGTNLQIDKNNDGKFWGKEENIKTAEIIVFCGQNFLLTWMSSRSLVLAPTKLQLAKLNEPVPVFLITLLNGRVVSPESLKGKPYVLDFWASWCVPCVKNLPDIKALREAYGSVNVISVNVDTAPRKGLAQKITEDAGVGDFTSIRGLGNDDPVWKSFGGANSNRLIIPLYILIDENGLLRYAGNGGEKLTELRREIEKLRSAASYLTRFRTLAFSKSFEFEMIDNYS